MPVYHLPVAPEKTARFCRTPVAGEMLNHVQVARALTAIGTIVGAPGIGKTTTLRWYAENTPGAAYATMKPSQSSMQRVLKQVLAAVTGSPATAAPCADLHDWICDAVRQYGTAALLIDESQHLDDRSLDELRCIHDETGVPMIFAGNESLRARVAANKAAAFAQFASRAIKPLRIKAAKAGDVEALAAHYGIDDPEAVAWLKKRCGGMGGLRTVARLMVTARKAAGKGGVRLAHLKEAAAVVGGAA